MHSRFGVDLFSESGVVLEKGPVLVEPLRLIPGRGKLQVVGLPNSWFEHHLHAVGVSYPRELRDAFVALPALFPLQMHLGLTASAPPVRHQRDGVDAVLWQGFQHAARAGRVVVIRPFGRVVHPFLEEELRIRETRGGFRMGCQGGLVPG